MALNASSSADDIKKELEGVDPFDKSALQEKTKDLNPSQVFEVVMPYMFEKNPQAAQKVAGINATFQFIIEGDDGGNWAVKLGDGLEVVPELDPNANCTITMKLDDWKAMNAGTLNPQMAFMSGKLKFKGDMSLAMRLGQIMG